jgi:hypothetical protein
MEKFMKGLNMIRKNLLGMFTLLLVVLFSYNISAQFETDTSQERNPEYLATADQLVEDLKTRLTLTDEQSQEIKEILIDYQQDIHSSGTNQNQAEMGNETNSDFNTDTEFETETDFESDTQTDIETDTDVETDTDITTEGEFETETDIQSDVQTPENTDVFSDNPQEKANQAIEEILNDTQRTTWTVIKDAWWRDVNSRFGWDKNSEME